MIILSRGQSEVGKLSPMIAYGFAIFTGAFLLFQVQPLMGKYVLPWFGGAPAVWTTCMLFFQVMLLAGYAYAHLSSQWLRPRVQVLVHLALLGIAIATLPITPNESWKPNAATDPTLRTILLLIASLGLPYFVLSATAPLMQHWLSRTHPLVSPFRFYALSNAGSLLALLSYPTGFEIWLTRSAQATFWGAGLGVYALACGWCGLQVWKSPSRNGHSGSEADSPGTKPTLNQKALWILLPACASLLLLAVTNKICQDVAVIAFLWVVPLAVYLLSFIICFDRPQWYNRRWFGPALAIGLAVMGWSLIGHPAGSTVVQILVYILGLFLCCMVCHGEVYRLRPSPRYLTSFYLMLAAGGALGGVFVAVIAPAVFADYFEIHCGLVLCGLLFLAAWARELKFGVRPLGPTLLWTTLSLLLIGLGAGLWSEIHRYEKVLVYQSRNFYGVLKVCRYENADPMLSQAELLHGRIVHGMQFLHPQRAGSPTLYYGPQSGVGRVFGLISSGSRRIGVVGLGVGTLAAYGQRGDEIRFYEINPEVEKVARTQFTFLRDSPARSEVVLGDARLSLEREPPQNFDLLVLDAFNSDAIPVHLLTQEAFEVYGWHVKTNGLVAVHVSNASLNLEPVIVNLARRFGYEATVVEQRETSEKEGVLPSTWMLLSRSTGLAALPGFREAVRPPAATAFRVPLWTDDFSGLFPVFRWGEYQQTATKTGTFQARSMSQMATTHRTADALAQLREELRQHPDSPVAMNNLACLLAIAAEPEHRDGAEAVRLAEQACVRTKYENAVILTTLAAAYAECGRFDEAIATGEKACTLSAQNGEQKLLERNRELLELYRRREPYHQRAP